MVKTDLQVVCFHRSTEEQRLWWGSCESTERGYKLMLDVQGTVGLGLMSEPSYRGGVGDRQVDKQGNRVLDRELACAKAQGQGIACYIRVGTPSSLVLLEHRTKHGGQLGQSCRNELGRSPQSTMPASSMFLWGSDQGNSFSKGDKTG